jgi:hypothetical protein
MPDSSAACMGGVTETRANSSARGELDWGEEGQAPRLAPVTVGQGGGQVVGRWVCVSRQPSFSYVE